MLTWFTILIYHSKSAFFKLNWVFGHISFMQTQTEHGTVVIPQSDKLLGKSKDIVSPFVVEVNSSVKIFPYLFVGI